MALPYESDQRSITKKKRRGGGGERVDSNYKTGVADKYFMRNGCGCLFSSQTDEPTNAEPIPLKLTAQWHPQPFETF